MLGGMCAPRPVETQITSNRVESRLRLQECETLSKTFKSHLQHWFGHAAFLGLRASILGIIKQEPIPDQEPIPVFLEICDAKPRDREVLYGIPWHLWDLFSSSRFEMVLQAPSAANRNFSAGQVTQLTLPSILAVFGSNEGGLQLQDDRDALYRVRERCGQIEAIPIPIEAAPGPDDPIVTPNLLVDKLHDSHCQILFFAGHSTSNEFLTDGQLQINDTHVISIDDLQASISEAIRNGLILAIFNSCDGLGIANALVGMGVPYVVVMRERIPDDAARRFLVHFLDEFLKGAPLYMAVKRARGRLAGTQVDGVLLPFVSWLPVTYQHPAQADLIWSHVPQSRPTGPKPRPVTSHSHPAQPRPTRLSFWQHFNQWRRQNRWKFGMLLALLSALGAVLLGYLLPLFLNWPQKPVITIATNDGKISEGEQTLISKAPVLQGIGDYKFERYEQAIRAFHKVLADKRTRNDPEILIYWNNALAEYRKKHFSAKSVTLAASVLAGQEAEILRGVAQAQTEFNCGSIQTFLKELQQPDAFQTDPYDSQCQGADQTLLKIAIATYASGSDDVELLAQRLVDDDSILGVVGRYISSNIENVSPIFANRKVLIAPTSNAVRASQNHPEGLDLDPNYVFRTTPDTTSIAQQLADYVKPRIGNKSLMIVSSSQDAFADSLKNEVKQELSSLALDADPTECNLSPKSNFDAENCLASLRNAKMGGVLLIPEVDDVSVEHALKFLKVLQANPDTNSLVLLGSDTLYNPLTLSSADSNYGQASYNSGILITVPWARSQNDGKPFEKDARSLFGTSLINWRTALSYDATRVLIEGMQPNASAKNLQAKLASRDFKVTDRTATGEIRFSGGDRVAGPDLQIFVRVVPGGSQFGFNFERIEP